MYDDKDLERLYDEKYFSTRSRVPMWIRRAEFIIEKFHPEAIISIGYAGALTAELKVGDLFIADHILNEQNNSVSFEIKDPLITASPN